MGQHTYCMLFLGVHMHLGLSYKKPESIQTENICLSFQQFKQFFTAKILFLTCFIFSWKNQWNKINVPVKQNHILMFVFRGYILSVSCLVPLAGFFFFSSPMLFKFSKVYYTYLSVEEDKIHLCLRCILWKWILKSYALLFYW